MRHVKLMFLVMTLFTIFSCPGPPAKIKSFTVTPQKFCSLPHTVTLKYEGSGSYRLDSSPHVDGLPVTVSGTDTRMVTVTAESTTFTLTGTGSPPPPLHATVDRLTDRPTKQLGCSDPSCVGGQAACAVDYSEVFDPEIVITQTRKANINPVTAEGPSGTLTITESRSDVLNGLPVAGPWRTRMLVVPPCIATAGLPEPIRVEVDAGCPAPK